MTVFAEGAALFTKTTDVESADNGLHVALLRVATLLNDTWEADTGCGLYTLSGDDPDNPDVSAFPVHELALNLAETGVVLCEAMTYAVQTAAHMMPDVVASWPLPYLGHVVVEEMWGLWGTAAEKDMQARATGRRRIPAQHRPDRVRIRNIAAYTTTGRVAMLIHRKGETPLIVEPRPEQIDECLEAHPLLRAVADLTGAAVGLLTDQGHAVALPPGR